MDNLFIGLLIVLTFFGIVSFLSNEGYKLQKKLDKQIKEK
jgi:hypothetical protein